VAYGYSAFCNIFTYSEWANFEYAVDLYFAGTSSFQSPTGMWSGGLDGWCELDVFLRTQEKSRELARYEYACNGEYEVVPYGDVTHGTPNN